MLIEIMRLSGKLQLTPEKIITDFECSAIKAFTTTFNGVNVTGCFFHLSQCIWRRVQAENLTSMYESSIEFSLWIRMILATAFVPIKDVRAVFKLLVNNSEFPAEAMPIADYFEYSYVGIEISEKKMEM